jgi:hypothetical protein
LSLSHSNIAAGFSNAWLSQNKKLRVIFNVAFHTMFGRRNLWALLLVNLARNALAEEDLCPLDYRLYTQVGITQPIDGPPLEIVSQDGNQVSFKVTNTWTSVAIDEVFVQYTKEMFASTSCEHYRHRRTNCHVCIHLGMFPDL